MVKLWIVTVFAVAALAQVSMAADLAEALNVNIREQLRLYDIFSKEPEAAKFTDDLKKLVEITEGALKSDSADFKEKTINEIDKNFGEEFNTWIGGKLEHAQVNDEIIAAIGFYGGLVSEKSAHEEELKKTVGILENLLKETDLKKKEDQFMGLTKTFSPEFEKYLKDRSLPVVNATLKKTVEFFEMLLKDKEEKYAKEIEGLKVKAEAALADSVSIDDKNKALTEVSESPNKELNEYLAKKNIELA